MKCNVCNKSTLNHRPVSIFGMKICFSCVKHIAEINPEDIVYDYYVGLISGRVRSVMATYR